MTANQLTGIGSVILAAIVAERVSRWDREEKGMDKIDIFVGFQAGGTEPSETGIRIKDLPIEKVKRVEQALIPLMPQLTKVVYDALNK